MPRNSQGASYVSVNPRGVLFFTPKKFKRGYVSFLRTRTFVFPFPACASTVRMAKTARTNKKDPTSGIYGHREEEALFRFEEFHSLRRIAVYFSTWIASTKLKLWACRLIALFKIATSGQTNTKPPVKLWRDNWVKNFKEEAYVQTLVTYL